MAARGSLDDRGPLQLAHDVRPIDPARLELDMDHSNNASHRFQGFPDTGFSDGRKPILGLVEWDGPDKSYKRAQHFVKGVPAGNKRPIVRGTKELQLNEQPSRPLEKNDGGIQYGSSSLPPSGGTRRPKTPKKTLFLMEDRTSADERKRTQQTRDADWDLRRAKQEKRDSVKRTDIEKRQDLEQLKNYKPWGREGAGAPPKETVRNRRTKCMEPEKLGEGEKTSYFPSFGRPGNGAPLRTDSGTVITNLRANQDIRFLTTKGMKENASMSMRYTNSKREGQKYINELGNIAEQKRIMKQQEKAIDAEQEKYAMQHDPFGKPGHGAPMKTDSGTLITGHARTLTKNQYEMREVEHKQYRRASIDQDKNEPWGKGNGVPVRDDFGNIRRFKWANENNVQEYVDPSVEGATLSTRAVGGGGHRTDEKGERVTRNRTTLVHDKNMGGIRTANRNTEPAVFDSPRIAEPDPSDPWGKPGAGAPMMTQDGKVATKKTGRAYNDKMGVSELRPEERQARKQYLSTLKKEIDDTKTIRKHEDETYKKPGDEVASWIRNKDIGYTKRDPNTGAVLPIHHKHTSDVTQQRMDIRRPTQDPVEYHTDLSRQAEQRHHNTQLHKVESRDLAQQHHENFDTLWGKPGNGAPNPVAIQRTALDMENHAQTDRYNQAPWKQPHAPSALQKRAQWNRTTSLNNRFQPDTIGQTEYKPRAPYAVQI